MKCTPFILSLLFATSLLLILWAGLDAVVYGKYLSDKNDYEFVIALLKKGHLSYGDIESDNHPSIKKGFPLDIISKYRIRDYGQIPRWSKMNEAIESWFDSTKKAEIRSIINSSK